MNSEMACENSMTIGRVTSQCEKKRGPYRTAATIMITMLEA